MPSTETPTSTQAKHELSESSRLDNFVDGAFAFAITLLIISGGSLPRNVSALQHALLGVPAFAACFMQLAVFWHGHVRWRDLVRLTDGTGMRLSLLLVFFALIFVFPLHLVFAGLFNGFSGGVLSPDFQSSVASTASDTKWLFACYGASFACMAGTLAALYRHGAREHAGTDDADARSIRVSTVVWGYMASVALLSFIIALVMPPNAGWIDGLPGFCYFLMGFTGLIASRYRKRITVGDVT